MVQGESFIVDVDVLTLQCCLHHFYDFVDRLCDRAIRVVCSKVTVLEEFIV